MLKNKIENFIENHQLIKNSDHLLLAVSGGVDSMVLLDIMYHLKYKISVAHCNFNLRGEDAKADELLVKQVAEKLGLDFYIKSFDTARIASQNKESIQVCARNLRYNWFNELAKEIHADKIVTAHHLNDQEESFFINLLRGTSLKGLSGIPIKRDNIVRPLLEVSKSDILQYQKNNKILFREDRSNNETKYLRNKIRLELLPLINEIQPAFESVFKSNLHHLKQVSNHWETHFKKWKSKKIQNIENELHIPSNQTNSPFFHQFLNDNGFSNSTIENIKKIPKISSGKIFYSADQQLLKNREYWILSPIVEINTKQFQINDKELPISLIIKKETAIKNIYFSNLIIAIDQDKVIGELQIRNWQKGDYFIPFGSKGKQKLSDYFINNKIKQTDKHKIWLLCDEKNIIWLIGFRMDERYRVDKSSKNIISITYASNG